MSAIPPALPSPAEETVIFPPVGWVQHPENPKQYYRGSEVMWEDELRSKYQIPEIIATTPTEDPALLRMLQESGVEKELPATGEFAASPELAAALTAPEEQRVDMPVPHQWSAGAEEVSQRGASAWQQASPLGNIQVTPTEQMLFIKQAAHNREVSFEVHVGPGDDPVIVRVRSLSNKALAAIYRSLGEDRQKGVFGTDDMFDGGFFTTRMQILSMMLQVEAFSEDFKRWSSDEEILELSEADLAAKLSAESPAWGAEMSAPRFALLVTAVRIFEQKFKICKEALANGDFSNPAS